MAEHIEREAAIEILNIAYPLGMDEAAYDTMHSMISKLPAADVVEVRNGRWLTKEYMYGDPDVGTEDMWIDRLAEQSDYYAYCSICGKDAEYNAEGSLILSDYCPNCGAKMDGGADDG